MLSTEPLAIYNEYNELKISFKILKGMKSYNRKVYLGDSRSQDGSSNIQNVSWSFLQT